MLNYKQTIEQQNLERTKLVLCPSFPFLPIMHSSKYEIGAQDVSFYESGSYTGEVSASSLKSLDVKYVIIGHYERENYFLENIEKQKQKIANALKENLKIILPIGENLMEYQLGITLNVIFTKLDALLKNIPDEKKQNIIIAYEPTWKIGRELPLNKKEIVDVIVAIKKRLIEKGFPVIPVLYGGGIKLEELPKLETLDGFLLGTLSLNVEKMCKVFDKF